jgi:RpiR family transcriptional regulator, carbohydrate utilization regulator
MIIASIEANLDGFRPSEQLVANFVLGRPSVVVHMSIADIAESCAVSEPTIMRFCKAIGCLGFMEFKLALARDLERRTFTMSRTNPAVKGPTGFGQALFTRALEDLRSAGDGLALDCLDEILEFCGASRAITVLHGGSEAHLATPLIETLLACRFEARAQADLDLKGRTDGRVVLALRSATNLPQFHPFCSALIAGEGKIVVLGAACTSASLAIDLGQKLGSDLTSQLASDLVYLVLLETLRLGIAARLSRDGLFSDTAADMLQSQREIAYGDARRRDRQSAQVESDRLADINFHSEASV